MGSFKDAIDRIKRRFDEGGESAGEEQGSRVNVSGRVNKAVSTNVGGDGSKHGASSKQKVRIRQDGEETYEESETVKTNF